MYKLGVEVDVVDDQGADDLPLSKSSWLPGTAVSAHLLQKVPTNRVLLLINPFSGQQRAKSLWSKYGVHVMRAAEIQVDVINTEYTKHATKILQELDIDLYDAILVNSGDGLVAEAICGLLMRKDRDRALKFPICHIPGGTSNALAAAICYACNEPFSTRDVFVTESCLMVTRPRYIPLRLYTVDTQYDGIKPMFMSATWGLIADIGDFFSTYALMIGIRLSLLGCSLNPGGDMIWATFERSQNSCSW
uniref:DAGKc domain-containing protein n=1 Tax=Angiostrongylus cantonensis TaxID=6313 RepID=A0A0K0D1H4_ANGCA